jgi:hypothetical protein
MVAGSPTTVPAILGNAGTSLAFSVYTTSYLNAATYSTRIIATLPNC